MGKGRMVNGRHFKDENTKGYLYKERTIGVAGERARFPRAGKCKVSSAQVVGWPLTGGMLPMVTASKVK